MKYTFTAAILLLLTTTFISCKKNNLFLSTSDKLIGVWKYEEVKSYEALIFDSEDITQHFENLNLEFKSDNSLTIFDMDGNIKYTGSWSVEYEPVHYGSDTEWEEYIHTFFTNVSTGKTFIVDWKNLYVTNRKLRFTDYTPDKRITYKLER